MEIQENVSLGPKTTMRIGGTARYYADIHTKEDLEEAVQCAKEKDVPFIILGGGSNTIFADGEIDALIVRIKADDVTIDGNTVTASAGKNLAMLLNELADQDLDLSALTGIPGTVGGAIFGNAGQGPKGVWIDSYVQEVEIFSQGEWKTLTKKECDFDYRESGFKKSGPGPGPTIIWSATLKVPSKPAAEIKAEIEQLLQRRLETQPHVKTAGSCFKAVAGTPAWQLIDQVGLRGHQVGGIQVSEKHANFLLNIDEGSFEDVTKMIAGVEEAVPEGLEVEMRLFGEDGGLVR